VDQQQSSSRVIERRTFRPTTSGVLTYCVNRGKKVTTDVIVAKRKELREYLPGDCAGEILSSLLDLAQGRLKPTNFADRFGFMGYDEMVPRANWCPDGEPLYWLVAHARTLFVSFKLINLASKASRGQGARSGRKKLVEFIRELPDGPYAARGSVWETPGLGKTFSSPHSARQPLKAANIILRKLLNPNITGIGHNLIGQGTELRSVFIFKAPIEVAYWYLTSLIGKSTLYKCKECGRVFMHGRPVEFCLPEENKTISKCKTRFNMRERRKRLKKLSRKRG
jgi:hypothetical protein